MSRLQMGHDTFSCKERDGAAVLELKGHAMQLLTDPLAKDTLIAALGEIEETPGVRGLIVINSPMYPGDQAHRELLEELTGGPLHEGKRRHYSMVFKTATYHLLEAVLTFSLPLVCGLHGKIGYNEFGLNLAFDYRLATLGTEIGYRNLPPALPPSGVFSYFLKKNLGPAKAMEILLRDQPLGAEEVLSLGLITRIVAEDELETQCVAQLDSVRKFPHHSAADIRLLVQPDLNQFRHHIDKAVERAWNSLLLQRRSAKD